MFASHYRFRTHAQVPATTGGGKSKLIELFGREHNLNDVPIVIIDGKHTTVDGMVNYYARIPPAREVIVINPSDGIRCVPLRFFNPKAGANVSAHAARVAQIILNSLGTEQVADVPRYSRMVKMLCTYCAVSGKPIGQAMEAFYFHNRHLARQAADLMPTAKLRNDWRDLAETRTQTTYNQQTESTRNRLDAFLTIDGLRRMFGTPGGLDLKDAFASGANILIDVCPSPDFPKEGSAIVGSFATSELLAYVLSHIRDPQKRYGYFDEVEMYPSADLASLLELSAGAGFRATVVHHHDAQFTDQRLIKTIEKNCRIKFIGTGTTAEEARRHVGQVDYRALAARSKKDDVWTFVTDYVEEDVTEVIETDGGYEGVAGETSTAGANWTMANRMTTRLRPERNKEIIGQLDHTPEEKMLILAVPYLSIEERQFRIVTPRDSILFDVPLVVDYMHDPARVVEFLETRPYSFPNDEIDRQLTIYETPVPQRSPDVPAKRKTRPTRLFDAGRS